jgi:hypothetical protein
MTATADGVSTRDRATPRRVPPTLMSTRALNRATLARQLLLARSSCSALEAVEHLVGLQAQAPSPPYYGLWSRVEGFRPDHLVQLLVGRRAVRIVVMRSTVHLVSADDALLLRPWVQPVIERELRSNPARRAALEGVDLPALATAGRAIVEREPLTAAQLGAVLSESWPGRDPASLAYATRILVPLVQVPPRGVWGASGQARCTSVEAWTGRPVATDLVPDELVLRYLAAFGPASVNDVQTWSGLTRLGEIVDRLRPRLRTFRADDGAELFDLPDAPRPDPDVPAPVRFLPEFDNALVSHANRSRIISDEHRHRLAARNGMVPGTVLVDGYVRAAWKIRRALGRSDLEIIPFDRLSKRHAAAVRAEGNRLLRWASAGAGPGEVRMTGSE